MSYIPGQPVTAVVVSALARPPPLWLVPTLQSGKLTLTPVPPKS